MENLIQGLFLIFIGGLNLFFCIKFLRNPPWAKQYIKKSQKGFLLRKLVGEERAYYLTKKIFAPSGIVVGVVLMMAGLFFTLMHLNLQFMEKTTDGPEERIVYLEANDTRVLMAQEQAQKEMNYFINSLRENSSYIHVIKTYFTEKKIKEREHMWLIVDSYSDDVFYSILINEPEFIYSYKKGDKIAVNKKDVEDWVILDENDNITKGNFLVEIMEKSK